MRSSHRAPSIGWLLGAAVLASVSVQAVSAQSQSVVTIDPGMTREQVFARLGTPNGESHFGSFTYLFYENGCVVKCGIDDVVVLEKDIVTDAVFRSPKRSFTGVSSPPVALPAVSAGQVPPTPLRAATSEDSAHPGGIVFAQPHAIPPPPRYTRIVPNRADSARMAAPSRPGESPTPTDSTAAPH
jgi:hypothetical protein